MYDVRVNSATSSHLEPQAWAYRSFSIYLAFLGKSGGKCDFSRFAYADAELYTISTTL